MSGIGMELDSTWNVAFSVARFTSVLFTPGRPVRASSTWFTQAEQDIPLTGIMIGLPYSVVIIRLPHAKRFLISL